MLQFYDELFSRIEKRMWENGLDAAMLRQYQLLVAEMDQQLMGMEDDSRHRFIVVIPVADRPRHLQSCLESLLHLCRMFPYGRAASGSIDKIAVLIADDSREQTSIQENKRIAADLSSKGLETIYFSQQEQWEIIQSFDSEQRKALEAMVGDFGADHMCHKGASIMRNITYIKLQRMSKEPDRTLFYFVDSDQEFQVTVGKDGKRSEVCALNYFYFLDRIFSRKNTTVVTGKVVGDPPVSPAVMASNFLDDVMAFLSKMAVIDAEQECLFHTDRLPDDDMAAYHDMADLFGFDIAESSFQYRCELSGKHSNKHCFQAFAQKLKQFFDGEHPTRKTFFNYADILSSTVPARTVYTGNYIFNRTGLKYYIPFATLGLRMAGPTLGRLLGAELGDRFVSANLPMLHKRTVAQTGQSEFRPGIVHDAQTIDLSGEFERQYFGDVMLFTVESLIRAGYPKRDPGRNAVKETLEQTESQLRKKYLKKQQHIREKLVLVEKVLHGESSWWSKDPEMQPALSEVQNFVANIQSNFGPDTSGVAYIQSSEHRARRLRDILDAILHYKSELQTWQKFME
ncbi:hypothetical protein [Thiolapillus sp.]